MSHPGTRQRRAGAARISCPCPGEGDPIQEGAGAGHVVVDVVAASAPSGTAGSGCGYRERAMPRRCLVAAAQERVRPYREDPAFVEHRRRLLGRATGRVLDLSLRPQANRELFPIGQVSELTVVSGGPAPSQVWISAPPDDGDPGPLGAVRLIAGPLHAEVFGPASFDTVVTVLTLCTVEALEPMLEAIGQWLAPSGQLLTLEHIRATGFTAMAQSLATPLERRLIGGCRLDQDLVGACRHTDLDLTDGARFSVRVAASLPIPCLAGVARPRARNRERS